MVYVMILIVVLRWTQITNKPLYTLFTNILHCIFHLDVAFKLKNHYILYYENAIY